MTTAEADVRAIEIGTTVAYAYEISAQAEGGTLLEISWRGVPNRNPSKSGDFVAIWQNSGSVPWGTKPESSQSVTNSTPDGDLPFSGLSMANLPYVAAYSVGSDATNYYNVAAVIPIAVGGTPGTPQTTTVGVAYVGATSLAVAYTTPIGVDPKTFGHTVVLAHSDTFIPGTTEVIATVKTTDNPNDVVGFTGVRMIVGQTYTVAYLAGSAPANVAATVTFLVVPA
ncbi:hypothetical protein [Actinoplanes sp. NPDC049265]|uniref:hypothetical protein n=1 Tax=Actinoplanes sp. NPDC049265 TaxID=3363902 RepID=UPI003723B474